ncbi:MAG: alpha/beta hydrolase [Sulfitobacter sp.]
MPRALTLKYGGILLAFVMAACAPHEQTAIAPPAPGTTTQQVWAVKFRPVQAALKGDRTAPRPDEMGFEQHAVSIPPDHVPGQIEWPRARPDARRDFVTLSNRDIADLPGFAAQVAAADTGGTGETVLFVHGYNTRHGEALYMTAQIAHDFALPSPSAVFSWPSSGISAGYLYDRDSVLISRDHLEQVILALSKPKGRKLVLIGHSMGNLLVMETLRQMEIAGTLDVENDISALILMAPDIDGELFYTQASRLRSLPEPSVIIAAKQDKALRLSAFLTGRSNRLGSQTDRSAVRDLPITVVDATDLGGRGPNHNIATSSPVAIAILRQLEDQRLPGKPGLPPLLDLGAMAQAAGLAPQTDR